MKDIAMIVMQEIHSDDGRDEMDNERIVDAYNNSYSWEKAKIDDIFISLCGWTLANIILKAQGE